MTTLIIYDATADCLTAARTTTNVFLDCTTCVAVLATQSSSNATTLISAGLAVTASDASNVAITASNASNLTITTLVVAIKQYELVTTSAFSYGRKGWILSSSGNRLIK